MNQAKRVETRLIVKVSDSHETGKRSCNHEMWRRVLESAGGRAVSVVCGGAQFRLSPRDDLRTNAHREALIQLATTLRFLEYTLSAVII